MLQFSTCFYLIVPASGALILNHDGVKGSRLQNRSASSITKLPNGSREYIDGHIDVYSCCATKCSDDTQEGCPLPSIEYGWFFLECWQPNNNSIWKNRATHFLRWHIPFPAYRIFADVEGNDRLVHPSILRTQQYTGWCWIGLASNANGNTYISYRRIVFRKIMIHSRPNRSAALSRSDISSYWSEILRFTIRHLSTF